MTESVSDLIHKWNEQRLDLFAISQPNSDTGEFHGVIRFYHKDQGEKVATKCIRVSSTASTQDVIETLREKFRSDMRMLSQPVYALYVTHSDGEWRRLDGGECPLMVQLGWVQGNRDGRFLVKNEGDKYSLDQIRADIYGQEADDGFKKNDKNRKSSKKKNKKNAKKDNLATNLYNEVKESQFTRTISNPNWVVKENKARKHARALQSQSSELTIYTDLTPTCYFVKVIASPIDQVDRVVEGALAKLGVRDDPENYLIAKCVIPVNAELDHCPPRERGTYMHYDECPAKVLDQWDSSKGTMVLVLQPPPPGYKPEKSRRKRPSDSKRPLNQNMSKPKPPKSTNSLEPGDQTFIISDGVKAAKSPQLLEIRPSNERSVIHKVWPNVTEVGFVPSTTHSICQYIKLPQSAGLLPRHCVLANMEEIVTITPHENARVVVDGIPIRETHMLENAGLIILGQDTILIFLDAMGDGGSHGGGITGDQLKRKIQEAQGSVTNPPNIQKPINAPFRPRVPTERTPDDAYPTPIIQYTEEPGKIARKGPGGPPSQHSFQSAPVPNGGMTGPYTALSSIGMGALPSPQNDQKRFGCLLPAQIDYQLGLEDTLLTGIFQAAEEKPLTFRLAPSYALYLCVRFHYQVEYRTPMVSRITHKLQEHIELNNGDPGFLAFWMANSSELLNFLRQDKHLAKTTEENQEELAQTVQMAFKYLVHALEDTLLDRMRAFLSTVDDDLPNENGDNDDLPIPMDNNPTMYDIIEMLNNAMSLLRRCRVNAALTIQLFSQLFHFINMYLFNIVMKEPELKCKGWGTRIRLRLSRVEAWAEKQGLELAAECHLARVTQAMNLLKGSKYTMNDVQEIRSTCFKLNSLQLHALLTGYSLEPNEKFIPPQLINQVVMFAKEHADQLTREDGRDVTLEEDEDLQLPFLLPEDGYTSDVLRGVPGGLHDFIEPLQANGLCVFHALPEATGLWTVYFVPQYSDSEPGSALTELENSDQSRPIPVELILKKKNGGLGLSIVAARGSGQAEFGIYIKSVVPQGAACDDGRLVSGDLLVAVDDTPLHGLTQDKAADVMRKTGDKVKLTIIKDGARIYGLDQLLSQPSPQEDRKHNIEYKSPEQVRNGLNLMNSGENYKHISHFNSGFDDKNNHQQQQADNSLPVPPKFLLNETVESQPEYSLPPMESHNGDMFEHEYALPPDQIVSVKKPMPSPPRHSKQSSGEASSSEQRSNDSGLRDENREKSSRKPRKKDDRNSRHRSKGDRSKRSDSRDSKNRVRSSDAHSTSGTLGRRNKGGMWEDPQQRMIQEQLDSMRDDEIIELKNKPNKTPKDEERLKILISEQEFSRALQKEHMVQSGTSEIESLSEEDFSNIPDRPDRDRLLKNAEMVGSSPAVNQDDEDIELQKIRKQQQQQEEELMRQKEQTRRREEERRLEEERLREEKRREDEKRWLKEAEEREAREREELRKKQLEAEQEARKRKEAEERRRQAEFEAAEEELRRQEEEEEKRRAIVGEERRRREDEERFNQQRLEEQHRLREEQRLFEEQRRKLDEQRRQMELEREELENRRRQIEQMKLEEEEIRKQRETQRQEVENLKRKAVEREQRSKEKERIRREQQELETLKKEMDLEDLKSQRPWQQQSAELRDLEDTIEKTINDKPKSTPHVYAAEITQHTNRIDQRLEEERKQLEDQLSRPYTSNQPTRATRPTSSYIPPAANHPFNKRPLSSYNPKIPSNNTQTSNNQHQSSLPPPPAALTDPVYNPDRKPSSSSRDNNDSFSSPNVIGAQELYNDPRERKLASIKRDNSILRKTQPDPSKLAFKDRHKLFEGQVNNQMKSKPKMSKKLLELEQQFGGN